MYYNYYICILNNRKQVDGHADNIAQSHESPPEDDEDNNSVCISSKDGMFVYLGPDILLYR